MSEPKDGAAVLAALKRFGVNVVEVAGWQTHERDDETGKTFGPVYGVMVHHTAGVTKGAVDFCRNGSAALPGPLCHGCITKDGKYHLISNGRANHAGGGDPDVLAAVKAERTPLPKTDKHEGEAGAADGNDAFYGFECVNKGDGVDPWPAVQLDTMQRAAAAYCWLYGWSAKSVIRHLDWSDYKSDPKGVDWPKFQAAVQKLLDTVGSDKPPTKPPTTPTQPKPPTKPVVSLKAVQDAARRDPAAPQGKATHPSPTKLVEDALVELGYLDKRWADGSFGTKTVAAYQLLQRHLGYSGKAADGIPGMHSLTWLAQKTQNFTAAA